MTVSHNILFDLFTLPVKKSLERYRADTFLFLAECFGVDVDEDWKLSEMAENVIKSPFGKALERSYFNGETAKELNYYLLYTEEIYLICDLLGIEESQNRDYAAKELLRQYQKIRSGQTVILQKIRRPELLEALNNRFYNEKIQT